MLLRSHHNFGRVRDQPGFPAPEARLIWDILYVSTSPHLSRLQVIEIEALSIRKNFYHQNCVDVEAKILFRVESHVFAGPLECGNTLETP